MRRVVGVGCSSFSSTLPGSFFSLSTLSSSFSSTLPCSFSHSLLPLHFYSTTRSRQHSRPSTSNSSPLPSSFSSSNNNGIAGPWVKLKYITNSPCVFPSMIQSQNAKPGDFVTILDKGTYNCSICYN